MHQAPLFYFLKAEINILYSNTLQQISHNYSQISLLFFTGRKYNIFMLKWSTNIIFFMLNSFNLHNFFIFKILKIIQKHVQNTVALKKKDPNQ